MSDDRKEEGTSAPDTNTQAETNTDFIGRYSPPQLAAFSRFTAQAEVITYPQRLMNIARSLIDDEGQFSFAVVVAHTACEIATERSLDEAFVAKGISDRIQDWVKSLNYGYNLGSDRIRRLYTALTGDELQKEQDFWQKFKASVERRHRIVHKGVMVEKADAEASYEAASELLARLKK
jgi:hypothetical protein